MIDDLLNQYFKLFLNDGLVPEWEKINKEDKVKILKEALKDNKNIVETSIYKEKYEEKISFIQ